MSAQPPPIPSPARPTRGGLNPVIVGLGFGIVGAILLAPSGCDRWTSLALFLVWGLFGYAVAGITNAVRAGNQQRVVLHALITWLLGTSVFLAVTFVKLGPTDFCSSFGPFIGGGLSAIATGLTAVAAVLLVRIPAIERMGREWTLSVALLVIGLLLVRMGLGDRSLAMISLGYLLAVLAPWMAPMKLRSDGNSYVTAGSGVRGYAQDLGQMLRSLLNRAAKFSANSGAHVLRTIKFECAKCGQHISADIVDADGTAPCPGCGQMVRVPRPVTTPLRAVQQPRGPWLVRLLAAGAGAAMVLALIIVGMVRHQALATSVVITPQEERPVVAVNTPQSVAPTDEYQRRGPSETAKRAIVARIESLESDYSALRKSLISIQSEKAEYDRRVQDYFMDHKEACVTLGFGLAGADVIANKSRTSTDGEKFVAGLATGYGLVWAYNHPEEAKEVGNAMATVVANQQKYKEQITRLQREIDSTTSELSQERAKL